MNGTNTQKARGRGYYSRYIAHYTKKNYLLLTLSFLFIIGVFFGTILVNFAGGDTLSLLFRIVSGFVDSKTSGSLLENFVFTSLTSLVFVGVLFISGFCAVAQPLILLLPIFRGLGFGFTAASLFVSYGTQAIGFVAVLIIPDMIISTIAILLCCRESMRLSTNFWTVLNQKPQSGELYSVKIYLARYFGCSLLCVASAFINAVLYVVFANFFTLG